MPVFVHLTSQRNVSRIRRLGIGKRKWRGRFVGVFAMPVTRNFYVSHQWLRELRRWGAGTIVGVYFRVPDEERVWVGHYNRPHVEMTAAEAAGVMMRAEQRDPARARKHDQRSGGWRRLPNAPEGYEVIIPRRIEPSDIIRIRSLPQVVGWRYMPGSKGTRPCTCLCCAGGTYGAGKLLRAVEEAEARGRETKITVSGREADSFKRVERLRREIREKREQRKTRG
jgi:hypothetical protein